MQRICLLVVLLTAFCLTAWPQQEPDLAKYIAANFTKREVSIPTRDGVKLFTIIYEPKDRSLKYPILFNRTPYSFPLVARNPQKFVTNYQLATNADFQKATQRVYLGGKDASAVVLNIVKK